MEASVNWYDSQSLQSNEGCIVVFVTLFIKGLDPIQVGIPTCYLPCYHP